MGARIVRSRLIKDQTARFVRIFVSNITQRNNNNNDARLRKTVYESDVLNYIEICSECELNTFRTKTQVCEVCRLGIESGSLN